MKPKTILAAMTAILSLTFTDAATGQDARLSVLSARQPGTQFHVGVSTPDKAFTKCVLFVSAQGPAGTLSFQDVPVVFDPNTAIPIPLQTQVGAGPGSDPTYETKWTLNVTLPPSLPSGLSLHVQALLTTNSAGGPVALTNGVVAPIVSPGPTEKRWIVRHRVTKNGSQQPTTIHLVLDQIDVDLGVVAATKMVQLPLTTAQVQSKWNAFHLYAPPQVSSDGGTAVLSMRGGWGEQVSPESLVYVLDMENSTNGNIVGAWLPPGPSGIARTVPRFLPGQNDRFWILERWTQNAVVHDARLACYSTDSSLGFPLLATALVDVQGSFSHGNTYSTLHWSWDFDDAGTSAWFLEQETPQTGSAVWASAFAVVGGVVSAAAQSVAPLTSGGTPLLWDGIQPFGGTRMLASVLTPNEHRTFGLDATPVATASAPFVTSKWFEPRVSVAADRSYAVVHEPAIYPVSPVVDGSSPVVAGQSLPILPPVTLVSTWQGKHLNATLAGDAMLHQSEDWSIRKLTRDPQGFVLVEAVNQSFAGGGFVAFLTTDSVETRRNAGPIVAFRGGDRTGAIVRLGPTGGSSYHVGCLDTETMTHAWSLTLSIGWASHGFFF